MKNHRINLLGNQAVRTIQNGQKSKTQSTATIPLDLRDVTESRAAATDLIGKVGGADVFVISAGTGNKNPG
jgi:short-subunit dehydrogenase